MRKLVFSYSILTAPGRFTHVVVIPDDAEVDEAFLERRKRVALRQMAYVASCSENDIEIRGVVEC